jgi:hypothetical protein
MNIKINAMGFRGRDVTQEPAPGIKRLTVIGDSVVEGHGVQPEQTFTAHLQEKLADSGWEVINLGVQGASPVYYAANLERYLYLKPDAVLLLINENDLYEDEIREKAYFNLPFLANRKTLYSGGALHSWYEKSRLASFLAATIQGLVQIPLEKIIKKHTHFYAEHETDTKSSASKSSFIIPDSYRTKRWEMSQEYLTFFYNNLQRRGIDLLVTSLCTVTLAFPDDREYTAYCSNLEENVSKWAKHNSVPYLSLIPTMKKALHDHEQNDILIFKDMHPTPLAHTILSEKIYSFVVEHLLDRSRTKDGSCITQNIENDSNNSSTGKLF